MWFVVILSSLSYACNGSLVDQSTQSSVNAELNGTDITKINIEVEVMKGNFHALLLRVINNEHELTSLKGQTQQMEHELENTKRTFSCEIEGLRDVTIQFEQELNETINALNTINDTIQDLSHRVSVIDDKYSALEIPGSYGNESGLTGDKRECPLNWTRSVDFGACYFFSDERMSWNDAQAQCSKQNGSLADIYSEKEDRWVADYCNQTEGNGIWIGGKRDHGVFKWFTSNGKTKDMNYTQWITDLENVVTVYPNYICVTIIFFSQYEWFSYDCYIALNFICKTYL